MSLLGGCSSDDGSCGNNNDRDGDNESSYTDCYSNDNDKNGGDEGWLVKEKKNGNGVLQSKGLCVKA